MKISLLTMAVVYFKAVYMALTTVNFLFKTQQVHVGDTIKIKFDLTVGV